MTIALSALAVFWLGHLWRSRSLRERRWHVARELRRTEREQQWRAMILDADERRAR